MGLRWFEHNRQAVLDALCRGEHPDLATNTAGGPLDELVALHIELGVFDALSGLTPARLRAGLPDFLLFCTLAVLPFLPFCSLDASARLLFREPAILLRIGWTAEQIQRGSNRRHRHRDGRQPESLPCHPDTLRDAFRRIEAQAWRAVQEKGVRSLFQRQLIRGKVYAIDGTAIGSRYRLVCLVCVSGQRPIIAAWRLLSGTASEKGKEAAVTRELIEQVLDAGGPNAIELLLADALYADGPLFAWLVYHKGIDVLTPLPSDRLMFQDLMGLARRGLLKWTKHRYTRTISGHKSARTVMVAGTGGLDSWPSFREAAAGYGISNPSLWAYLIQEIQPHEQPLSEAMALVSTRPWVNGFAAYQGYRPRWHVENDGYRELKEGWELEKQAWGRDLAAMICRATLTILAFNTVEVYRTKAGQKLAKMGIRRLRQECQRELGPAPGVVFVGEYYAVLSLEEILEAVGRPVKQGLRPQLAAPSAAASASAPGFCPP